MVMKSGEGVQYFNKGEDIPEGSKIVSVQTIERNDGLKVVSGYWYQVPTENTLKEAPTCEVVSKKTNKMPETKYKNFINHAITALTGAVYGFETKEKMDGQQFQCLMLRFEEVMDGEIIQYDEMVEIFNKEVQSVFEEEDGDKIPCLFCEEGEGGICCSKCQTKELCYDCSKLSLEDGESPVCPNCHNKNNIIPPMTHPLSSGWKNNPKVEDIIVTNKTATMSRKDFDKLLDYSRSTPTGVYEGKMWKNYTSENSWYLNWWGSSDEPDKCKHFKRLIVLKEEGKLKW